MRYTVAWEQAAEDELILIWMNAVDKEAVRDAADQIDPILAVDPETKGEEFYGDRLLVVAPLSVTFSVLPDDRLVKVLSVWRAGP